MIFMVKIVGLSKCANYRRGRFIHLRDGYLHKGKSGAITERETLYQHEDAKCTQVKLISWRDVVCKCARAFGLWSGRSRGISSLILWCLCSRWTPGHTTLIPGQKPAVQRRSFTSYKSSERVAGKYSHEIENLTLWIFMCWATLTEPLPSLGFTL